MKQHLKLKTVFSDRNISHSMCMHALLYVICVMLLCVDHISRQYKVCDRLRWSVDRTIIVTRYLSQYEKVRKYVNVCSL